MRSQKVFLEIPTQLVTEVIILVTYIYLFIQSMALGGVYTLRK